MKADSFWVDLALSEWQVVEIPLDVFAFRFPYIESLALDGNFKGSFFIDDVRLVAASPPNTAIRGERTAALPQILSLEPNYPNPFNRDTVIRFALPRSSEITLAVYSLMEQQVASRWREHASREGTSCAGTAGMTLVGNWPAACTCTAFGRQDRWKRANCC